MKTSKDMTNEEIAKELLETVGLDGPFCICERCSTVRESAARLRAISTPTVRSDNSKVIAELERRLTVAEDALVKMTATACAHCDLRDACQEGEDGMIVPCNDMIAIRDALAAIRMPVTDRNQLNGGDNGQH